LIVSWLAQRFSPESGNAGAASAQSNRIANAIHDLLAIDVDVAALLPPDGAADGFDNIADSFGTSLSLIRGYVSTAVKISRRTVVGGIGGGPAGAATDITIDGEKMQVANSRNFRLSIKPGPHTIGAALIDRQKGGELMKRNRILGSSLCSRPPTA
jgi:hypothetical protein